MGSRYVLRASRVSGTGKASKILIEDAQLAFLETT